MAMERDHSMLSGKVLHAQTKQVLNNVYNFMENEAKHGDRVHVPHLNKRLYLATGVSCSTYYKIREEYKLIESGRKPSFETPGKCRMRKQTMKKHIEGAERVVRDAIYDMYISGKRTLTIKSIRSKLTSALGFKGSISTVRNLISELGFRSRRLPGNSGKRIFKEKHNVRVRRITYLRDISRFREEGRPIVFLDEAYITNTLVQPTSKVSDHHVTIVHGGGDRGFVPNALWISKTFRKIGDYESSMSPRAYEAWLTEKVIPNLAPRSVLVVDDAPFHNEETCPTPRSYSPKSEMQHWLAQRNIDFERKMLAPELYSLIKQHKPRYRTYRINNLLVKHGHAVLRIPPRHPDLNPFEEIWKVVKGSVAKWNAKFDMDGAIAIAEEKLNSFGESEWAALCCRTQDAEKRYLQKEALLDQALDKVEGFLNSESESESSDEEEYCACLEPEEDAELSDGEDGNKHVTAGNSSIGVPVSD